MRAGLSIDRHAPLAGRVKAILVQIERRPMPAYVITYLEVTDPEAFQLVEGLPRK